MMASEQHGDQDVEFPSAVVVIPALNEEESLPLVLNDLPSVGRVIVVDNGSTDQTAKLATELGATVVEESQRGYGSACLRGLSEIDKMIRSGLTVDVVAFVDADYSDHVHLLGDLLQPVLDGQQDFVLGSRLLGEREPGAMPPQSVYGNKLACGLMNLFFRGRYTDLGPMRAISMKSLDEMRMVDQNFGWTIEMQLKALRHKLRILELPVPYRRRIGTSKISGTVSGTIRAGTKILYSLWRYGWSPNRDR
ncbi:glycosyltransferase family 2 protein [Mariniblastus sp.]|nr:glycosyltransferase family 2 protein [Mariniblastus sp.]